MERFTGILLLSGDGRRFEGDLPKQFCRLSGKKIYLHTLEKFLSASFFHAIILVTHPHFLEQVKAETAHLTKVLVTPGGKTRQESSFLGAKAAHHLFPSAPKHYVIIHDAVRPFVSHTILQKNKELVTAFHAVDTCIPSTDSLVHSIDGFSIDNIPNRTELLRGQTPQSFLLPLLLSAHETTLMTDATDDCQLVKKLGSPVVIAEGSETNIKITSPLDLYLAEQLLRKEQTRELLPSTLLSGKVFALVGASGGIGKSILQELQNANATILPISKSSPLFPVDLSKKEEVCALFDKIHDEYGEIDGLINVAGCLTKKELSHLSFDEIDYQLMVNLHAIIYSCKVAKIKAGGHIINISSSSFSKGRASLSVYSASKAGVVNFSQALADELTSLKVNVIVPQRTSTAMRLYNFKDEELSSLLSPEEVASRVIALLKTEGVTGQIIEVVKS